MLLLHYSKKKPHRVIDRILFLSDMTLLLSSHFAYKILPLPAKVKVKPERKCKNGTVHFVTI